MPAVDSAPVWRSWAAVIVILVAVVAVYRVTLENEFVTFDDRKYIYENTLVTGDGGLGAIWADLWNPRPRLHYYPLTFSTFWIEHKLVGLAPPGAEFTNGVRFPAHPLYHWTQMILHAINAGLILFVLRALGVRFPIAVFTSAFFALHPVNVCSVAWMAERKNLVSSLFLWTALLLYISYRRRSQAVSSPRKRGVWLYGSSILAFVLALCGKAAAVVLAPVLILTDRVLDRRWTWQSVGRSLPFFALALVMAGITSMREQFIAKSWEPLAYPVRPFIAVSAVVHYVAKMLLPVKQALIYPRWPESLLVPRYWISLAVVMVAGYLIWRCRKRLGDLWLWGLGLFLLTVAPVIGLKNFIWMQYAFVSDHYMYYGSAGVILMIALLLERWCRVAAAPGADGQPDARFRFNRTRLAIVGALSLAALAACGWRSVQQCRTWRDNETLWTHTIAVSPDCMVARMNLGNHYGRCGKYEQALEQYREQARIDPHFATAWRSCARTARTLQSRDEAVAYYQRAVAAADAKNPRAWSIHAEYADYLGSLNRREQAVAEYQTILKKRPADPALVKRIEQAIEQYRRKAESE